jgi:hypothetical protein
MVLSTRIAVPAKKSRRLIVMISQPAASRPKNAHATSKFLDACQFLARLESAR